MYAILEPVTYKMVSSPCHSGNLIAPDFVVVVVVFRNKFKHLFEVLVTPPLQPPLSQLQSHSMANSQF